MTARAVNPLGSLSVSHTRTHKRTNTPTPTPKHARTPMCAQPHMHIYKQTSPPHRAWNSVRGRVCWTAWAKCPRVSGDKAGHHALSRPSRDITLWGNSRSFEGRGSLPLSSCDLTYEGLIQMSEGRVYLGGKFPSRRLVTEWCGMCNLLNLSTRAGVGDQYV